MRILILGTNPFTIQGYCRIAESTTIESCKEMVQRGPCFECHYLHNPTEADFIKQMTINQEGYFHACLEI